MLYEPCPRCRSRGRDSRGDNLVIWPDSSGHCFSCGFHRAAPWTGPVRHRVKENGTKGLPADFTREVPTDAWKWLLQYGLPYSYWQESAGYSPSMGRLFLQVPGRSNMDFAIGRLIEEDKGRGKWYSLGDSHKSAHLVGQGPETVIVEDWISANKVGQVTECLPLFGVEVHPAHLYALREDPKEAVKRPIVLWLDKDQGGSSQKKAARLQMLTNRPTFVVHTDRDPKSLTFKEIKETLNEVY